MSPARRAARLAGWCAAAAASASIAALLLSGDGDPSAPCRAAAYRDPVTGRAAAAGGDARATIARCRASAAAHSAP